MTDAFAPDPADLDPADLDRYDELTDEQLAAIFEDLHGPQPGEPADGDAFARDPEDDDEPDDDADQDDEQLPPAVVDVPTGTYL